MTTLREKREFFKMLVAEDGLSHAYLFFGMPGGGKRQFARELAAFLEHGDFGSVEPLTDCRFISAREGEESIGIDVMREMHALAYGRPFRALRRLLVVEGAELLTDEAQGNALKLVEDAPRHACFIFIASDPETLITPLASRLARVYFPCPAAVPRSGTKEGRFADAPLALRIEHRIIELYTKNKLSESRNIALLLKHHTELSRYNLNPRLQEKAIAYNLTEKDA